MHQTRTRVNGYNIALRREVVQVPKMRPGPDGPQPEVGSDGEIVLEPGEADVVAFTDLNDGDEWVFFADTDFRVEMIRVLSGGLDEEQKQRVILGLTGGIIVPGRGTLPLNREQRRARGH